jgi:glycosyltransferase involved in cell wall biosynthesis
MPIAEQDVPGADLAIVIPAYRPGEALLSVTRELSELGFQRIVVVDDGSGPSFEHIFTAIGNLSAVRILRHPHNLGKGAALKTGIGYALREYPDLVGIVTADADGQHRPEDIREIALSLGPQPGSLILGSRAFDAAVPLRSRLGNIVTRAVVRLLVGQNLQDTQTGLRAIPARFAASLLKLTSSGYEFELDMLIAARNNAIQVLEQPIQTIYESGNKSSHFNPLVDSMKIYFVLARFCSVALVTALLDNVVFYLVYSHGVSLLTAQLAGRGAGLVFNYLMVRDKVFRATGTDTVTLPRYLSLVLASGAVSYACIRLVTSGIHVPVLVAKLAVESLLFFVNFVIARDWVFANPKLPQPAVYDTDRNTPAGAV